jgi:hypothetical protein
MEPRDRHTHITRGQTPRCKAQSSVDVVSQCLGQIGVPNLLFKLPQASRSPVLIKP